jgi:2-dehydropantoate 2-reductase
VRNTGSGACAIGRDGGGLEPPLGAVVEAFSGAGFEALAVADIERWVWRKLAINAAINPLTALIGVPNRAIADDPDLRQLAATLAEEVATVARARGLTLDDAVEAALAVATATGENRSSMLRDLEQGQPTEIEAITGAVVAEADRLGVATPANRLVAALIRARERAVTDGMEGDRTG